MGRPRGAKDLGLRMRKGELTTCARCPLEHPGWSRTEIKRRDKTPYCAEHLPDKKVEPRNPQCPDCGAEFDFFRWGGSVETTTVHCPAESCGFVGRALDYYDAIDIKVMASPIERPEVTENV